MVEFLSDDPTWPAAVLGLAALIFLVQLKVTQQGKYLIYAAGAAIMLLALLALERVWVTDAERIENTVYGLAKAVEASDADRAAEFLTPDCVLQPVADRGDFLVRFVSAQFAGPVTKAKLEAQLPRYTFDWVRITKLRAHATESSGMGTADFVVHTMGMQREPTLAGLATPPSGMGWSLGLTEVSPQVWKVNRITPGRLSSGR